MTVALQSRIEELIEKSDLVSRDLSWVQFNRRVLDQARKEDRGIFECLKFLAITASNEDEFFMIRLGSLYNYLDYGKERVDYSGLKATSFRKRLLQEIQDFSQDRHDHFIQNIRPNFRSNGFEIVDFQDLTEKQKEKLGKYFKKAIYPMLTPMVYDSYHSFPILMNNVLIFGVVTRTQSKKDKKKMSFIQIPQNIPRFFEIADDNLIQFVPVEQIIREFIGELFRNVNIVSVTLFRVTRNGDFTLEESEDIESNFLEEMKAKLKTRKTGRVVKMEVDSNYDKWLLKQLTKRWDIDSFNISVAPKHALLDYKCLWQIINHQDFEDFQPVSTPPVKPLSLRGYEEGENIFKILSDRDILLHHPYNSIEPLLELIEKAAEDPNVMLIKLTIYRLAKNSRIIAALQKAAENGKHVSVLFEVKARFDEENNMKEAQKLQKAGCFVIYGVGTLKTHTKLLLIVRKEKQKVTRYIHMGSGNYNENTANLYTDLGLLTTNEEYANDVSEFFNVITGHSLPDDYETLLTAPKDMRDKLIALIQAEEKNALEGIPSGIVIKINSLQDKETIEALYSASQAGVPIKLIVRGICCIRPGRAGLSENISVRSIVGEYLEHSRIYYFHNAGEPIVYSGSADVMVRSFDRRLESLFVIKDELLRQQAITILDYNLKDNVNAYEMNEDGSYSALEPNGAAPFNIHKEFFNLTKEIVLETKLF